MIVSLLGILLSLSSLQPSAPGKPEKCREWDVCAAVDGRTKLGQTALSKSVLDRMVDAIGEDVNDNDRGALAIVLDSSIVPYRLSSDSDEDYLVAASGPGHPDTGATGNRGIWIFKTDGTMLLEAEGWGLTPRTSAHHGMRDVAIVERSGSTHSGVTIFQFDGKRYQPTYYYSVDEGHVGLVHKK